MEQADWNRLSYVEKNRQLYYQQKRLLDTFLSHHTISKEQYDDVHFCRESLHIMGHRYFDAYQKIISRRK